MVIVLVEASPERIMSRWTSSGPSLWLCARPRCRRVKSLIADALAEVHKTQEQEAGLADLRAQFSEGDWDAFRSLAAPASYFC